MSRLFVALIATAVLSPVVSIKSALAADMPVKAPVPKAAKLPYDWSGLYLGGHIGYMWGRTRVEEDGVVTEPNAGRMAPSAVCCSGTIGRTVLSYLAWKAISDGPMPMAPARGPAVSIDDPGT